MALLGNLISRSLRIRKSFRIKVASPRTYQRNTLRNLLERGQYTSFGKHYGFGKMLSESVDWETAFREEVPFHNYNSMFAQWWHKCLEGEENVTWPGKVKYFALSSGTSESASKHIPVTQDMIRSTKKVGFKQFYSMTHFKIPSKTFEKGVLMLGGSTSLMKQGDYYEGDMSGISAKNMPRFLSNFFYKPGQKISRQPRWEKRIKLIIENAPKWDVGILCGVPAWAQIVLEEIVKKYNLNTIHDMWPNLRIYIHGGVAFEPYRENFKKLMGVPVTYIETYMASEGSFGFQARPGVPGIKLVLNAGIFYEFVPFNSTNFDDNGDMIGKPQSYFIDEVNTEEKYAVVLSTCAGAWRYLIGDVVQFTDVEEYEITIVGRTKQFLSLCGEHTSIDNLNKAIDEVNKQLKVQIKEFTVGGFPYGTLFAHKWFIGCDDPIDAAKAKEIIDATLCDVNDDYAVERTSALKEVFVEILPTHTFIDYLKHMGKFGAMNKFPRVMKGQTLKEWEDFLKEYNKD
ncbi:GH3 auxin-responsive promoter family protein [Taibaiella lutea]|uniref:GH3 auxin-responsive promoter family protein n=1 Tax=Taibaiella lutea TaxID=2608001 RepID=A0A5M6CH99_9BACT|nr:GH3 auxin-responsive promoter family protein [Taibaiella lutea]KAA5534571.1 GH3 auxin-responsive promoter family protein [Taibaiella lutea]